MRRPERRSGVLDRLKSSGPGAGVAGRDLAAVDDGDQVVCGVACGPDRVDAHPPLLLGLRVLLIADGGVGAKKCSLWVTRAQRMTDPMFPFRSVRSLRKPLLGRIPRLERRFGP